MNLAVDMFDKVDLISLINVRAVKTLILAATVKTKPDTNLYKQINTRQYVGETIQSWKRRLFLLDTGSCGVKVLFQYRNNNHSSCHMNFHATVELIF